MEKRWSFGISQYPWGLGALSNARLCNFPDPRRNRRGGDTAFRLILEYFPQRTDRCSYVGCRKVKVRSIAESSGSTEDCRAVRIFHRSCIDDGERRSPKQWKHYYLARHPRLLHVPTRPALVCTLAKYLPASEYPRIFRRSAPQPNERQGMHPHE